MRKVYILIITSLIFLGCKKEMQHFSKDSFLQNLKTSLKDSLSIADYASLDFSKALLNRVDSVQLYFVRIPFQGSKLISDFVIVKTNGKGKVQEGKIIHLEGSRVEVGEGKVKVKRREFDGQVSISSLNRTRVLNSEIRDGYIMALHPKLNSREQSATVYPAPDLPEVVIVAYVNRDTGLDFSTWVLLNSFIYCSSFAEDPSGGGGGDSGGYYGSTGEGYSYGGGGSGSGGSTGGSGVNEDNTIAMDLETFVDHPAIDVSKYLKCFDNIPDDGATCSIEIFTDIPVDSDPTKLFNWNTQAPGHVFLELKKSNGTQSVQQSIGFYPQANWKNILSADPVTSKMVNDGGHEFNASLKMTVTPFSLRSAITRIKELSTMKYDMDEFNCTDFALEVFNYVRTPLEIPQYVIPGGVYATNTPQGLYNKLTDMWLTNDPEKKNITINILKGYVGSSSGPCN